MDETGIEGRTKTELESFGIRNIRVFGIRNPRGRIRNPRQSWIPLHGAIS